MKGPHSNWAAYHDVNQYISGKLQALLSCFAMLTTCRHTDTKVLSCYLSSPSIKVGGKALPDDAHQSTDELRADGSFE